MHASSGVDLASSILVSMAAIGSLRTKLADQGFCFGQRRTLLVESGVRGMVPLLENRKRLPGFPLVNRELLPRRVAVAQQFGTHVTLGSTEQLGPVAPEP